ncbi:MAG: 30S ribosomal protein S18 [Patescibacteria group bacterium]|nr:30S ribosomal protein S18 [Patescibacteria group bacterium]MDD4610743.1 30S ribosomal protein S18 [Patescibacteria group bacterium]
MENTPAIKKVKTCHFCENNLREVDYKNVGLLNRFINFHRQILPRKRTGVCSWHQRKLSSAVKRARIMALIGFTHK